MAKRLRIPPLTTVSVALGFGLMVVVFVTVLARLQPHLDLELSPAKEGTGWVVEEGVLPAGTVIVSLANSSQTIKTEALDLAIEPDGTMGTYETYHRFLDRQEKLARMLREPPLIATTESGDTLPLEVLPKRPLGSLPPDFWIQLAVGLFAWLICAAVFAFRPSNIGARYLMVSGFATLLFSPAAALYTTRELAIPGSLFQVFNDSNFFGGSLFAACFVALLCYYPRRIAPRWTGWAIIALFVLWFVIQQLGVFQSMTFARRFLVMVGVATTFVLGTVHWFKTRRDPIARASLKWFLLSWMFGTSLFAIFILLPQMFGIDTSALQGYSFLLFLLVYLGLALGILRYRLFDLGDWFRRVMVWALAVMLLILLDLLFLFGLNLPKELSLGFALILAGILWLPLRGWIWDLVTGRKKEKSAELFQKVLRIALASPDREQQESLWGQLLRERFNPLKVETSRSTTIQPDIARDGLELLVPAAGELPAFRLSFADSGRRLFSRQDASLAGNLAEMLTHAIESRMAYEKGASEERERISSDIHDNIASQLLSALHSKDPARKDERIRDTIADIRMVMKNSPDAPLDLKQGLADLRFECSERVTDAGLGFEWKQKDHDTRPIHPANYHALRSIVREALSNALKHSQATKIIFYFTPVQNHLEIVIADNGCGLNDADRKTGDGLSNMRNRAESCGGAFQLESSAQGTKISFRLPLHSTTQP
jgi:signal transduction histidine kinase